MTHKEALQAIEAVLKQDSTTWQEMKDQLADLLMGTRKEFTKTDDQKLADIYNSSGRTYIYRAMKAFPAKTKSQIHKRVTYLRATGKITNYKVSTRKYKHDRDKGNI